MKRKLRQKQFFHFVSEISTRDSWHKTDTKVNKSLFSSSAFCLSVSLCCLMFFVNSIEEKDFVSHFTIETSLIKI